jgi:hypothetical protein
VGEKDGDSGFRLRDLGLGIRDTRVFNERGFEEKRKGNSPSPLIPFDRLTTPLSLGGARKIKETGYHRPQAAYLEEKQYEYY